MRGRTRRHEGPGLKESLKRLQAERKRTRTKVEGEQSRSEASGKGKKIKAPPQHPPRPLAHGSERLLLVGEGDFSFTQSLLTHHLDAEAKVIATCLDGREALGRKYGDDVVEARLNELQTRKGVQIITDVDAGALSRLKRRDLILPLAHLDKIIFNFPHVGAGIKDRARNIQANQKLLARFLLSAKAVLTRDDESAGAGASAASSSASVLVTLRLGDPYDDWNLKTIARDLGWRTKTSSRFEPALYPGYRHQRTAGESEGDLITGTTCRTYEFVQ